MRERIGYAIAVLAAGLALLINAVAGDEPTGPEREAREIASATQRMGQRWDSEQIDDVRRAIADISAAAAACDARRSATAVALLAGVERAGDPVLERYVDELVAVHAVDGALRRGVRARLRDHREFRSLSTDPCLVSVKRARKTLKRHREREQVIALAADRLRQLGVSDDTAERFEDPELPVRERIRRAAARS